jgi:hypothetical protein
VACPYPGHGVLRRRKEFQGAAGFPHQEEIVSHFFFRMLSIAKTATFYVVLAIK